MIDGDPNDPALDPLPEPAGDPAGDAPAAPAPAGDAGIAAALSALNTTMSSLASRLDAVEQRSAAPQPQPPAAPTQGEPPAFDFSNPVGSIQQHATAAATAAVDGRLAMLTPFLESVASSLADGGKAQARATFDGELGEGAFDRLISSDLDEALSKLPPAQRANAGYVQAIASGVLGGKMLSADGRKELREIMAARTRPTPPVVLSGNGARRPAPGKLAEHERQIVADIQHAGVPFDEKAYLRSRETPRNEEAWLAAKGRPNWINGQPAPKGAA